MGWKSGISPRIERTPPVTSHQNLQSVLMIDSVQACKRPPSLGPCMAMRMGDLGPASRAPRPQPALHKLQNLGGRLYYLSEISAAESDGPDILREYSGMRCTFYTRCTGFGSVGKKRQRRKEGGPLQTQNGWFAEGTSPKLVTGLVLTKRKESQPKICHYRKLAALQAGLQSSGCHLALFSKERLKVVLMW